MANRWIFGGFNEIQKIGDVILTDENREEEIQKLKKEIMEFRCYRMGICPFCGSVSPGWECEYCGAT